MFTNDWGILDILENHPFLITRNPEIQKTILIFECATIQILGRRERHLPTPRGEDAMKERWVGGFSWVGKKVIGRVLGFGGRR